MCASFPFPAETALPDSHVEPVKMALEMVPSALEHIKLLHMALTPAVLQGVATIAAKKNLRYVCVYVWVMCACVCVGGGGWACQ